MSGLLSKGLLSLEAVSGNPVYGYTCLYNLGDECSALTGGWSQCDIKNYGTQTITFNSGNIEISSTGAASQWGGIAVGTNNQINVTDFAKLIIEFTSTTAESGADAILGMSSQRAFGIASWTSGAYITSYTAILDKTITLLEFDISSLSGSHYIFIAERAGTVTRLMNITKLRLE